MARRNQTLPVAIAYFDETGMGQDTPVFGLAGWVAYREQWVAFNRSWKRSLRAAGVIQFHMVDFVHRRGEFEGWTDGKRLSLIRALTNIVRAKTFAGIARAVEADAYASLSSAAEPALSFPSHPYVFCFQCCLEQLVEMCGPLPGGSIDLVFEETHSVKGAVLRRFEELTRKRPRWSMFNAPTFASKSLPPLQAADLPRCCR